MCRRLSTPFLIAISFLSFSQHAIRGNPLLLKRTPALAALICFCLVGSALGEGITSRNWIDHPAIQEIRGIYAGVRQLMDSKKLTRREKHFEDCKPYQDSVRVMQADSRGVVRKAFNARNICKEIPNRSK